MNLICCHPFDAKVKKYWKDITKERGPGFMKWIV